MSIYKTGTFSTTTGGAAQNLALGFVPDLFVAWNDTQITSPTSAKIAQFTWKSSMANASAYVLTYNATPIQVLTKITSNGVTPYQTADASLFPASNLTITGISQAAQASITATHAFTSADVGVSSVTFHGIKGMSQMNTLTGLIQSVTSTTSFTVNINSTSFTAYSSGGIANIITGIPATEQLAFQVFNTPLYNAGTIGLTFGTTLMANTADLWRYDAWLSAPFQS